MFSTVQRWLVLNEELNVKSMSGLYVSDFDQEPADWWLLTDPLESVLALFVRVTCGYDCELNMTVTCIVICCSFNDSTAVSLASASFLWDWIFCVCLHMTGFTLHSNTLVAHIQVQSIPNQVMCHFVTRCTEQNVHISSSSSSFLPTKALVLWHKFPSNHLKAQSVGPWKNVWQSTCSTYVDVLFILLASLEKQNLWYHPSLNCILFKVKNWKLDVVTSPPSVSFAQPWVILYIFIITLRLIYYFKMCVKDASVKKKSVK